MSYFDEGKDVIEGKSFPNVELYLRGLKWRFDATLFNFSDEVIDKYENFDKTKILIFWM